MEVQRSCFNDFPNQCVRCPEYTEVRQDNSAAFAFLGGMGTFIPGKIVKECKRYHKRKVENLK